MTIETNPFLQEEIPYYRSKSLTREGNLYYRGKDERRQKPSCQKQRPAFKRLLAFDSRLEIMIMITIITMIITTTILMIILLLIIIMIIIGYL